MFYDATIHGLIWPLSFMAIISHFDLMITLIG